MYTFLLGKRGYKNAYCVILSIWSSNWAKLTYGSQCWGGGGSGVLVSRIYSSCDSSSSCTLETVCFSIYILYFNFFLKFIKKQNSLCRGGCNVSTWPAGGAAASWTLLSQLWLESGWPGLPEVSGLPGEQQLLWAHRPECLEKPGQGPATLTSSRPQLSTSAGWRVHSQKFLASQNNST